jgi:pre-mRNA-processing factor 6
MMKAQILLQEGATDEARRVYVSGLKICPACTPLWQLAAALESDANMPTRARALLENARKRNPKTAELWLSAVRIERKHVSEKAAKDLMAKALQDCPNSGVLWAESIFMESPVQRRAKSMDALKHCENNPHVLLAVALLFLSERKISKARSWFNRTIKLDPDLGDAWAAYYKFELNYGTEQQQQEVLQHCITAEPRHGEIWQAVAKAPENWWESTKAILVKVAAKM